MVEKILNALQALHIDTYMVTETVSRSVEAFFIRKNLDLKRRTALTDYTVTVYRAFERDGERLLGASAVPAYPGMGEGELRAVLSSAYHAASFAGNPWYPLPAGRREPLVPSASPYAARSLEENLRDTAEALFASDVYEDVFINSAEIFSVGKTIRVLNSAGVDVSWEAFEVRGEYVIQCVAPADVETYYSFAFREPEPDTLRGDVSHALKRTRDRASAAEPPKAGKYTVLLSGNQVRTLLHYYLSRAESGMIYRKYSGWAVGQAVQGSDIRGDALTITLRATAPYDGTGIPLRDRPLLEEGVLRTVHGGSRFAHYLGIEPTGAYRAILVPTGSTPFAEMKKAPYLHVAAFSDFQMNAMTGRFGGEIRLGYLYDGETVKLVTGGSVNGSILEAQGHMVFSAERYRSADYEGPFAVAIRDVAVAGR